MRDLALKEKKRFAGSTSSLSGLLAHIYFLISRHQLVNTDAMAAPFPGMVRRSSWSLRLTLTLFSPENSLQDNACPRL